MGGSCTYGLRREPLLLLFLPVVAAMVWVVVAYLHLRAYMQQVHRLGVVVTAISVAATAATCTVDGGSFVDDDFPWPATTQSGFGTHFTWCGCNYHTTKSESGALYRRLACDCWARLVVDKGRHRSYPVSRICGEGDEGAQVLKTNKVL